MKKVEPIVVEQTYRAPVEHVWRAITDGDEMRKWFFEPIREFRPERGFETQFTVHNEGRDYIHSWRVTEVVPNKRIAYEWKFAGIPGEGLLTWELSETNDGTKLELTHTGLETFPQKDASFERQAGVDGWTYFLCDRLKRFLEG